MSKIEEGFAGAAGYAFGKLMPKTAKKVIDKEAAKKTAYDADTQDLLKRARAGMKEETDLNEAKKVETVAQFLKRGGKITHVRPHKAHGASSPQKIKVPYRMGKDAMREEAEQIDENTYHVYDNGGKTQDRYTAFTHADHEEGKRTQKPVDALGMDDQPTHPQGFSQGTSATVGKHLGKKIPFHSLPKPLQQHIHSRLSEEVEQLDELSKKTLGSYAQKAVPSLWNASHDRQRLAGSNNPGGSKRDRKSYKKADQTARHRFFGIQRAAGKLAKEEVEQLDELSKGTLKSYVGKATGDLTHHAGMVGYYQGKKPYKNQVLRDASARISGKHAHKEKTRQAGIHSAVSKLEEEAILNESHMSIYNRNENANRHTDNAAHLAKHYGSDADKKEASFLQAEHKKHGHQPHFARVSAMHERLYPKMAAAHQASVKEETVEEMATDQQGSDYRSQAAKQTLDMAAAAKRLKKGVTMREQFSPIGDVISLVANQQPGEATTVLTDLLSARISDSLAERKQEIAQSLFAPSADALEEANSCEGESEKVFQARKLRDKATNKKFGHNVAKGMAIAKSLKEEEASTLNEFSKANYVSAVRSSTDPDSDKPSNTEKIIARAGKYHGAKFAADLKGHDKMHYPRTTAKYAVDKLAHRTPTRTTSSGKTHGTDVKVLKKQLQGTQLEEMVGQVDEMSTRKDFQQVADVIKAHPDANKRRELAAHHSGIFKTQNPRFDHKRFYAAANAGEPGV